MPRWIHTHTGPFIALTVVALSVIVAGVTVALVNRGSDQPWTADRYVSYVRDGGPAPEEASDTAIELAGQNLCDDLDAGIGVRKLVDLASRDAQLPNGGSAGLTDESSISGMPLQLQPVTAERLVAGAVHTYCTGHENELSQLPDL